MNARIPAGPGEHARLANCANGGAHARASARFREPCTLARDDERSMRLLRLEHVDALR
jgi:hypothetical protein